MSLSFISYKMLFLLYRIFTRRSSDCGENEMSHESKKYARSGTEAIRTQFQPSKPELSYIKDIHVLKIIMKISSVRCRV